jgi:Kef-type K+ transport system membrane component KefB
VHVGPGELALGAGQVIAAAAVVLALTMAGGAVAGWLRQDRVIGEIAVGLLVAPAVLWLAGPDLLHRMLPAGALAALKLVAEAGLVLYLVGVTHKLELGAAGLERRVLGWVALGGFLPALCLGAALGGWLLNAGPGTRGTAPAPAFLVFVAVAMAITAVPVLARIIGDRGLSDTRAGQLALAAAIIADSVGWLLLSVALSLNADSPAGVVRSFVVLVGAGVLALVLRRALRAPAVRALAARSRPVTVVVVGTVALAVSFATEQLGLTAIIGAVLVGFAIPPGDRESWPAAVAAVSRVGRRLVPLYFGVTGFLVFTSVPGIESWWLAVLVLGLGIVGKVGGGYLGARLGRQGHWDALRIGTLMNTRGLTELVVLRAGYSAGILTGSLLLTMVLMALVTTVVTGPLLSLVGRWERARGAPSRDRPPRAPGHPAAPGTPGHGHRELLGTGSDSSPPSHPPPPVL